MNVLVYAPESLARQKIIRYLIDAGNYQALIAESQPLLVSLALHNDIKLVLLFDPANQQLLIDLKDFLREKRRRMRVCILPPKGARLKAGWEEVIVDVLKSTKPRQRAALGTHPRFRWKPSN
jgi:hypothetical protein